MCPLSVCYWVRPGAVLTAGELNGCRKDRDQRTGSFHKTNSNTLSQQPYWKVPGCPPCVPTCTITSMPVVFTISFAPSSSLGRGNLSARIPSISLACGHICEALSWWLGFLVEGASAGGGGAMGDLGYVQKLAQQGKLARGKKPTSRILPWFLLQFLP